LRKNFSRLGRIIKHLLDISTLKGKRRRPKRRRRRRPARRRWRAKVPRMSRLRGSSPPRMVQGHFLLLIRYLLLNDLML
jgi:hypothetical protein